jgi:hypothetical protein
MDGQNSEATNLFLFLIAKGTFFAEQMIDYIACKLPSLLCYDPATVNRLLIIHMPVKFIH